MSVSLVARLTVPLRMNHLRDLPGPADLSLYSAAAGHCNRLRCGAPCIRGSASIGHSARARVCNWAAQSLHRAGHGIDVCSTDTASDIWHGTTILTVRKGGLVAIGGDGQVSIGQTVVKANAKKVRRLGKGDVIGGFAGATADAFTLFERLEGKLEQYPGQLMRAAVELAKDWRTDRYLRRLEAMMIVADKEVRWCSPAPATCWSRKPA